MALWGRAQVHSVRRPPLPGSRPSTISSLRRTTCCPTPTSTSSDARSVHNITHIDVPRESDGPDRYERAADTLQAWIDDVGARGRRRSDVHDLPDALHRRHRHATGTSSVCSAGSRWSTRAPAGCCPTSASRRRRRPTGSTSHVRRGANLSPVWGLSLASGLTELLAEPAEPIASVTVDGVEHIVERVTDPRADRGHRRAASRRTTS